MSNETLWRLHITDNLGREDDLVIEQKSKSSVEEVIIFEQEAK